MSKNILYGLYNDEEPLLHAVEKARKAHLDIYDVYTPFPVHGLDHAMHLSEPRLHQAGFVYGAIGTLLAFGVMTWVFTRDWPIIFGGKPYWSVPAFIPITFELTVLLSAIGMTVSFYTICGMGPGVKNPILHERITDDKFCIAYDITDMSDAEAEKFRTFFKETGASEVHIKNI